VRALDVRESDKHNAHAMTSSKDKGKGFVPLDEELGQPQHLHKTRTRRDSLSVAKDTMNQVKSQGGPLTVLRKTWSQAAGGGMSVFQVCSHTSHFAFHIDFWFTTESMRSFVLQGHSMCCPTLMIFTCHNFCRPLQYFCSFLLLIVCVVLVLSFLALGIALAVMGSQQWGQSCDQPLAEWSAVFGALAVAFWLLG
jgi:hypothetical protein